MIKTYALQTLLAIACAVATTSLLASGHAQPVPAAADTCPVTQSLLAGALPLDAPPPSLTTIPGGPRADA